MKVFVTGATGAVGLPALRALVEDGHDVTAVARTPDKGSVVDALGATPIAVDLFDPAAVQSAVAGHDAIVNLATHIPPVREMVRTSAWAENDRIRREVSRNLVDAAISTGASHFVQESIAFMYEDGGASWLDEDTALAVMPYASSTLEAEAQAQRFASQGGIGIVLRFGMFHGPTSEQTRVQVSTALRSGVATTMGSPDGYVSIIHTDDAGRAAASALRAPSGIYNVVDDEPLTRRDYVAALAAALDVAKLRMLPDAVGKLGGEKTDMLRRSERVSNRRLRDATGWSPEYPSAREAFAAIVKALYPQRPRPGRLARILGAASAGGGASR